MTQSSSQYIISVSDDGVHVMLDFIARRRDTCQHKQIAFNRLDNELTCCNCQAKINPVTWIADFAEQLHRQANRPPMPPKTGK